MLNKNEENLLKNLLNKSLKLVKINQNNDEIKNKIQEYLYFLLKKNIELNLISRKLTTKQIIVDHIYDCTIAFNFFSQYKSICDLGTGAGLPGILLAIFFPDKSIKLIEKSHKKVDFLKECIKTLELKNVEIIEDLVENVEITYEVITCRAFKSILEILTLTKKFFYSGGSYILYKGKLEKIKEELKKSTERYKFEYNIYKLEDFKEKERHIVVVKNLNRNLTIDLFNINNKKLV